MGGADFAVLVADHRSNDTSCGGAASYGTCRFGEGDCRRSLWGERFPFWREAWKVKKERGPSPARQTLFGQQMRAAVEHLTRRTGHKIN
jgi:hypothetical protein